MPFNLREFEGWIKSGFFFYSDLNEPNRPSDWAPNFGSVFSGREMEAPAIFFGKSRFGAPILAEKLKSRLVNYCNLN